MGRVEFRAALAESRLRGGESSIAEYRAFFDEQFSNASAIASVPAEHADEVVDLPTSSSVITEELQNAPYYRFRFPFRIDATTALADQWKHSSADAGEHALRFAEIRRSAASDAITATSLYEVVNGLKQRGIPIKCHIIDDGEPRRFVWDDKKRRFIPSQHLTSSGPEMRLLGPSQSLVQKHWDRLPTGDYLGFLALKRLPVKSITPSNQLSYVVRVDAAEQGLLIAGDAGCVDFKPEGSEEFYPKLLQNMSPLHFIQVAHHAGQNAHFYNVLLEGGFPEQTKHAFLLLSHATHDRSRPSDIFRRFVELARQPADDFQLLFTSEPSAAKVSEFDELIHPIAGAARADRGDVRVVFDGKAWSVTKHSVQV
jgi:hypothetical protein